MRNVDDHWLADPRELGLDPEKIAALLTRVRREVDAGLLPAVQVALARHGRLAAFESFGDANPESLFVVFSATKAIVAAAAWFRGNCPPPRAGMGHLRDESALLVPFCLMLRRHFNGSQPECGY